MNKAILLIALTAGIASTAMAAEFKGYVIDQKCSAKPAMRGDVACATKCIRAGSPAVLVTPEGKIYKIDEQAKVIPLAGKQVTIVGSLNGDTIALTRVSE